MPTPIIRTRAERRAASAVDRNDLLAMASCALILLGMAFGGWFG
jgi:hypothetical protein